MDEYKVGDPDPTPDGPGGCPARIMDPEWGYAMAYCTLPAGHGGTQHVAAGTRGKIASVWPIATTAEQ